VVERNGSADKILQCCIVDLVAFVNIGLDQIRRGDGGSIGKAK